MSHKLENFKISMKKYGKLGTKVANTLARNDILTEEEVKYIVQNEPEKILEMKGLGPSALGILYDYFG